MHRLKVSSYLYIININELTLLRVFLFASTVLRHKLGLRTESRFVFITMSHDGTLVHDKSSVNLVRDE